MTFTAHAQFTRAAAGLVVSTSAVGANTVIAVRGEADFATLPVLTFVLNRVVADHVGAVIVDLTQTEFIDSAIVRAIAEAGKALGQRGRQLTLRSPSRLAVLMLGLSGFPEAEPAADADRDPVRCDLSRA